MNFNRTNHHRSLCALSACLIAIFGLNPSANADRFYVDGSLEPCGDGIAWGTAFRFLQDALDEAALSAGPHEIWVAAGTYYVDQSCANEVGSADRTETFQLVKDVFLLGGFEGTEIFASERDSVANVTILSGIVADVAPGPACPTPGSISCFVDHAGTPSCDDAACCQTVCNMDPSCCLSGGQNGWDQLCVNLALDNCGEAYHVVTAGSEIDDPEKTVIDGFTIRDGWANGSLLNEEHGGGMFIEGEPSVVRCTFRQNTAWDEGGGMTIKGLYKRPHIINTIFEENPGDPASPGDQQVFPTNGGGLASIAQADPIFTNCLFVGNTSGKAGGAIYNSAGTCPPDPPPGGACGRITLINCTVASNTANEVDGGHEGGGLHFAGETGVLEAENTIVWWNSPSTNQINGGGLISPVVNFSDCEDGCPEGGTGNIDADPLFVAVPANLRLTLSSPCLDKGNTDETVIPCDFFNLDNDDDTCAPSPEEATPDLDLFNRVLDGDDTGGARVDMGSYEYPALCPWDLDDDGKVGVGDLLILLANWGDPYGIPEFLALLAAWGPCPTYSVEPLSIAEELEDACLTQDHWDDFVDVMTDPESSEEDKDRYNCWMTHYLDHCPKCTCEHIPTCPGPDPFT